MLIGGIVIGVLLYVALGRMYKGKSRYHPAGGPVRGSPVRTTFSDRLTGGPARASGISTTEVQRGLAVILAERDADRAQSRADPDVVARRRRQVIINVLLYALTYPVYWYVINYQRVEQRPGWFFVSRFGSFLLYALSITRGMSIIALLRSPLRRPPGEWIFRAFRLCLLGARLLRRAARKVGGASGGRRTNVQVTSSVRAEVPNVIASARA